MDTRLRALRVALGMAIALAWLAPPPPAEAERAGTGSVRSTSSPTKTFGLSRSSSSHKKSTRKSHSSKSKQPKDWDEYQRGGHCLYGTNGELLHAPDGRPCDGDEPAPAAPTAPAPRPTATPPRFGTDTCIAGNCRDGIGTYAWSDGSRYTGAFQKGKPHGQGTLIYSDGGSYSGQWKDGTRTGYGTAAYADGHIQKGWWEKGRFRGADAEAPAPVRRPIRWPSLAQPASHIGGGRRDAAVVVGIERYANVPAIGRASDNAAAWFQYFVRTRGLPVENVTLLLDEDGTREDMEDAVARAARQVERGGTLWFVFIGHGAPAAEGGDGLLIGYDAQQKARSLAARSVLQTELIAALERSPASSIRVFLDACFSGRTRGGEPLVAGLQPLVVTSTNVTSDPRTTVITAARGDEYAGPLPGANRPAFSYLALGALRGWADADADGRVTAGEVYAYVSRSIQAVVRDRRQRPTLVGAPDQELARSPDERGPDLADLALQSARSARRPR